MSKYLYNLQPQKKSKVAPILAIGGGLITLGLAWYAKKKSSATTDALQKALSGTDGPVVTDENGDISGGGVFKVHATGYWPYQSGLSAKERLMEGGVTDRRGNPLHTLEQHQKDPVAHPYVSVAGDSNIWPYAQRIVVSAWPNLVFRVVDTGGHFHGINKVYRVFGEEPLDFAVDSSSTVVPKKNVTAKIIAGDNFEKGKAVATRGFKGQTVVVGAEDLQEARTQEDYEALARALESELGGRSNEELMVAAWSMRNRADIVEMPIYNMLAPRGEYGTPFNSGGYASTRKAATNKSREIATKVLDAPSTQDPTDGAVDFWIPSQQNKMKEFGDIYRASIKSGDENKAKKYEQYASFGDEDDIRTQQEQDGLRVLRVVGVIELLGKI